MCNNVWQLERGEQAEPFWMGPSETELLKETNKKLNRKHSTKGIQG